MFRDIIDKAVKDVSKSVDVKVDLSAKKDT